jgi:cell division protein ZapA (FtsZ GTPase activity inhibitor)
MSTKNSTLVRVFGREYRIAGQADASTSLKPGTSSGDNSDHITAAASYLDQTMREAAAATGRRSALDLAILAAMEIAREVLSVRRSKESLLDEAEKQIGSFTQRLDDELGV